MVVDATIEDIDALLLNASLIPIGERVEMWDAIVNALLEQRRALEIAAG